MNRRFVISFFIFVLLIINNLYAAPKNYVDEEKGYNLLTEIDFISEKMSEKDKNEYSQQLYDWCNEVGNNARILKKLPKDIEWGLQKGLSEFSIKSGETYVARITRIEQKNSKFFSFVMVLVTIVNSNSKKNIAYKIDKIIETNAELDLPNNNDTVEEKEDIYSSASLGYKGYAKANFYGIDLDEGQKTYLINALEDFSSQENYKSQIIKKLSKEQDWLLNLALNKYTLKKK